MKEKTKITASELLRIDEERTIASLKEYLHILCKKYSVQGVLIGLSGGIDSAVLVLLAIRLLGKSSVHTIYLYDRDSEYGHGSKARRLANWLEIDLETKSIESDRGKESTYSSWGMRISRLSPILNRFIYRFYQSITGESPFLSSLRVDNVKVRNNIHKTSVIKFVNQYAELLFYQRHRYRREVLESKARERKWLLLGSTNRSEWEIGWFVKDGVDDLPYQPLIGLYKTQVRQLASYFGIPVEIQQQKPSPDMVKGINDEFALGISYSKIDLILDYLAGGLNKKKVMAMGVKEEQILLVKKMKELSRWKRQKMKEFLLVNGSRRGKLRMNRA